MTAKHTAERDTVTRWNYCSGLLGQAMADRALKQLSSGQVWERESEAVAALQGGGPWDTHCVVIRMQVGHEHSSERAQDPVHVVPVVTTQLPKCAFTAVQQQRLVRAVDRSKAFVTDGKDL